MGKNHWADIDVYGRMFASIIKQENKNYKIAKKAGNEDMAEAHLNRVNITFRNLKSIADQYNGVEEFLKEGKKIATTIIQR